MKTPQQSPGRNDPCPCGSGRKFKNCCHGKSSDQPAKRSGKRARIAGIATAAGILAVVMMMLPDNPDTKGEPVPPPASSPRPAAPAGATPAPWEYDAANNRHWHAGHGHWHDGPPPAQAGAPEGSTTPGTVPASATPAPWEYDAANNRHWHAGHGHWHDGPPPPGSPAP